MKQYEVKGFYGHLRPNKTTIFVYEYNSGAKYYVVSGGSVVNKTYEDIDTGINVESISDIDCFTWNKPINTLNQLIKAVES